MTANLAGQANASRPLAFGAAGLLAALEATPLDGIDEIGFGLIVMNRSGEVIGYNAFESTRSGLRAERVMGRNFFVEVGPCTNNYILHRCTSSGRGYGAALAYRGCRRWQAG